MIGRRCRQAGLYGSVAVLVVELGIVVAAHAGLRWSPSESLPPGFYLRTPVSNLIEFCPPQPYGKIALFRGYRGEGRCADGGAPLLKPVIAQAGDVVEVERAGMRVNGRLIEHTAALTEDSAHRLLRGFRGGVYAVGEGQVWVGSSYNPKSYDSRYFGPIQKAAIIDKVRPLWIFPSKMDGKE